MSKTYAITFKIENQSQQTPLIIRFHNGLIKFPGVELFSCHDHQFVQTTANRIMEILPNGSMIDKITTYDEYLASDEMARKRTVYTQTEEDN